MSDRGDEDNGRHVSCYKYIYYRSYYSINLRRTVVYFCSFCLGVHHIFTIQLGNIEILHLFKFKVLNSFSYYYYLTYLHNYIYSRAGTVVCRGEVKTIAG